MAIFTRTYTQAFVDKVLPAALVAAKEIEGNTHIQTALETLGATQDSEGVYQMDTVPPKEQVGLLFDMWLWRNYKRKGGELAAQAAVTAVNVEADASFEDGTGA